MSKELFIQAHEELIEIRMSAWCDKHPDATDAEYRAEEARAYDQCADGAPEERFCSEDCANQFRADHPGVLERDEDAAYERDRAESLASIGWFGNAQG